MSHSARIIDRDIDTYQACLETEEMNLRRCVSWREPYYRGRVDTARAVVAALKAHRDAIDAGPTFTKENQG